MAATGVAPGVDSDPLTLMEDLDDTLGDPYLHLFAEERVRHGV